MMQTRVQIGRNSADSSLRHNAWKLNSTTIRSLYKKPAIPLVFLILVAASAVAGLSLISGEQRPSATTPNDVEATSTLDVKVTEQQTVTDEASGNSSAASVKVESNVQNGVPSTKVEVNGQELPVEPNTTTTHVTNQNGSQSTTSITNHSSQTSDGSFNSSTNTSTSTSSSQSVNNSSTWEED